MEFSFNWAMSSAHWATGTNRPLLFYKLPPETNAYSRLFRAIVFS